jgi:hypothetical protein
MSADLSSYIDVEALAGYITRRRNPDGGYCFYGLDESSLNDTFYAVLILEALGRLPEDGRTPDYVRSFQREDGGFLSVYSAWCALKALKALESRPAADPEKYILSLAEGRVVKDSVYIESLSRFETAFYIAELLSMAGHRELVGNITYEVMLRPDKEPSIIATYYEVGIKSLAGSRIDGKFAPFILSCAVPSGGFSKKPGTGLAFMDETYFGVESLALLGMAPPNRSETIDFISECQNENGGFRRALASGISAFYASYYALESLRALLKI